MVMERQDPMASSKTEYRLFMPAPVQEWLDTASSAIRDGFQVARFLGEDALLLER
jgi:hypothetical protein